MVVDGEMRSPSIISPLSASALCDLPAPIPGCMHDSARNLELEVKTVAYTRSNLAVAFMSAIKTTETTRPP